MDCFDLPTNIQTLVDVIYEEGKTRSSEHVHSNEDRQKPLIDKSFYQVRQSVCVAGMNGAAIRQVKGSIATLSKEPMALESFHVRSPDDLEDGVLLVPKVVLVAAHCPGMKVIDDEGDMGQLDRLYDLASEVGADVMLIYTNLPPTIYPPMTHIIYHPKMEDMVFPCQPLLRHLAMDNCFLTITEGCDLNALQKNVLQEWLVRPVRPDHPVYSAAADQLAAARAMHKDVALHGPVLEDRSMQGNVNPAVLPDQDAGYVAATEEHPMADKKRKKNKRKFGFKSKTRGGDKTKLTTKVPDTRLSRLSEDAESDGLEMEMYRSDSAAAVALEVGSSAVL